MQGSRARPAPYNPAAVLEPENPYLRGVKVGPRATSNLFWLWFALALLCAGIWGLATERLALAAIGILGAIVPLIVVGRRRAGRRALGPAALQRELQAVELARLRGNIGEAMGRAHAVLAQSLAGTTRASLFASLAGCAEQQCDLGWARDLYARALVESGWAHGQRSRMGAFTGPSLVARHAFLLAVEGKLDEASAELARAAHANEHPGARYLVARAEALVLVRKRQWAEALALLDRRRALLRYGANLPDRLLLHAMAAHARASLEGTFRGALPELSGADPKLRAWVSAVLPEAAPLVGGAP